MIFEIIFYYIFKKRVFFLAPLVFSFSALFSFESERLLSWDQAVADLVCTSPKLKIENAQILGLRAIRLQSGLSPNPIFSYSVENVLGSHHWSGWDSAESRYEIAQAFELGNKRNLRVALANALYLAEKADLEALSLKLFHDLHEHFVEVKAAEEFFLLALEQESLAIEYTSAISSKVDNGKASHLERRKAELQLASARIKREKANFAFKQSKIQLAKTIGICPTDFTSVAYPFFELAPLSSLCDYQMNIEYHPLIAAANLRHLAAWQQYKLEKSLAIPDLILVVGLKTSQECHDKGMIFGASLPLPVFNKNQGNIQKACYATQEADAFRDVIQNNLEKRLNAAYFEGESALAEALSIQEDLLTEAEEAYHCVLSGFESGKFDNLNLIEAKNVYLEIKEKYLEALLQYHLSVGHIEYLINEGE